MRGGEGGTGTPGGAPRDVVLYAVHYVSEDILAEYRTLAAACAGRADVVLLYDDQRGDAAEALPREGCAVHAVSPAGIRALGYASWPGRRGHLDPDGLVPGNWDFALLEFYRSHPGYARYWRIEFDVRFSGDWSRFFGACAGSAADLLGTTLLRHGDGPEWFWWSTLGGPGVPSEPERWLRGFFPVCRLSGRACALLDRLYRGGAYGHAECLMPTLLAAHGLALEDVGGRGEFVPPGHEDRFYVNTPSDVCLTPGTFVFRPALEAPGERADTLWHPVKDDAAEARWLRRLAEKGDAAAQFRLGVMYAHGRGGPVDLTEAYLWHHRSAERGHGAAEKWRDEIALQLPPAALAAAQARLRRGAAEAEVGPPLRERSP